MTQENIILSCELGIHQLTINEKAAIELDDFMAAKDTEKPTFFPLRLVSRYRNPTLLPPVPLLRFRDGTVD